MIDLVLGPLDKPPTGTSRRVLGKSGYQQPSKELIRFFSQTNPKKTDEVPIPYRRAWALDPLVQIHLPPQKRIYYSNILA